MKKKEFIPTKRKLLKEKQVIDEVTIEFLFMIDKFKDAQKSDSQLTFRKFVKQYEQSKSRATNKR